MLAHFFDYALHIDQYLLSFVSLYGAWTYAALFAVIFCETGLVIFPFLPGDSLLFVAGGIAARPHAPLSISLLMALLFLASLLGNQINYTIGKILGPKVFNMPDSWLLNKKHLMRTHDFYEKHGGKTIILARFIPIIRTFAPFIAGIGTMPILSFTFFNMISALMWISSLLYAGYFFGSLPFVKQHFSLIVYGIIIVSLLPPAVIFFKEKFFNK